MQLNQINQIKSFENKLIQMNKNLEKTIIDYDLIQNNNKPLLQQTFGMKADIIPIGIIEIITELSKLIQLINNNLITQNHYITLLNINKGIENTIVAINNSNYNLESDNSLNKLIKDDSITYITWLKSFSKLIPILQTESNKTAKLELEFIEFNKLKNQFIQDLDNYNKQFNLLAANADNKLYSDEAHENAVKVLEKFVNSADIEKEKKSIIESNDEFIVKRQTLINDYKINTSSSAFEGTISKFSIKGIEFDLLPKLKQNAVVSFNRSVTRSVTNKVNEEITMASLFFENINNGLKYGQDLIIETVGNFSSAIIAAASLGGMYYGGAYGGTIAGSVTAYLMGKHTAGPFMDSYIGGLSDISKDTQRKIEDSSLSVETQLNMVAILTSMINDAKAQSLLQAKQVDNLTQSDQDYYPPVQESSNQFINKKTRRDTYCANKQTTSLVIPMHEESIIKQCTQNKIKEQIYKMDYDRVPVNVSSFNKKNTFQSLY